MWLRLYTDILNNRKAQQLSGEEFKAWINLLALAKEHGGLIPPLEDVAFRLRTTEEEATRLVEVLVKRGLLDTDGANTAPHNWHIRQFESDNSTERVKRFRNVTETLPESEADTETEPEQSRAETEASRVKPRSVRAPVLPDDEYLEALQKNPAYSMLNVRHCYQKMMAWCEVNGRQPSRRRFINWLNKEDKPMTAPVKKQTGNANVGKSPDLLLVTSLQTAAEEAYMYDAVEDLIAAEDFVGLGEMYDAILKRGGAKAEWEIRVVTYWELHRNEPVAPEKVAQIQASINALAKRTEVL